MKTKTKTLCSPYEAQQNRKRLILFIAFALLATVLMFAAQAETLQMAGMGQNALKVLDDLFVPNQTIVDLLRFKVSGSSITFVNEEGGTVFDLSALMPLVTNTNKICENLALVLLCVMFCVSLAQAFIEGSAYDEIIMKKLIVFGMAIACVFSAQDVCTELGNIGTTVVESLNTAVTDNSGTEITATYTGTEYTNGATVYKSKDGSEGNEVTYYQATDADMQAYQQEIINNSTYGEVGFLDISGLITLVGAQVTGFAYYMELLIPNLCNWITVLLSKTICWSRAFELLLLIAYSPLAFVSISGHSPIDNILRFLKQYFAVVIQGAVIFFAIVAGNQIRGVLTGTGDITAKILDVVVVMVVQTAIIARSRSIAQTVVGN